MHNILYAHMYVIVGLFEGTGGGRGKENGRE
jgi:hypothetical protein